MSAHPIKADELLDLARSFVPPSAPSGRPHTAHLRRGISLAKAATLVDHAAEAVQLARRLRRDGDTSFQLFLRLMVAAVKIARTRTT